ncbi:MAG: hypothetical protein ACFFD7_07885 [Candidatus Thorarchaeota archaeon]
MLCLRNASIKGFEVFAGNRKVVRNFVPFSNCSYSCKIQLIGLFSWSRVLPTSAWLYSIGIGDELGSSQRIRNVVTWKNYESLSDSDIATIYQVKLIL